ncbi:Predicted phosphohydrolase, Cof family, HAD superfamily [Spirosomataceae bacterium TFI 002]|nr:Predicted phosphohydrolase, Cof family, HAD superfamily [Spirosomataceae bacterium TFI 002]
MADNFESPQALAQVADFHRTFHHPILDKPQIPSKNRADLRVELLSEELKELAEAIAQNDIVEVADALCDLQYVLAGAVLEFGLGSKFKELFDEVQRSNMSKACENEEVAKQTVAHYKEKGQESHYKKDGDRYLVFRDQDAKTLKSVNYSPADLKSIIG